MPVDFSGKLPEFQPPRLGRWYGMRRRGFFRNSVPAISILTLLLAVLLAHSPPAGAVLSKLPLYQSTVIVTGNDTRYRATGMAKCLRDVLVKVTGEPRLANDPRVVALMAHSDQFVAYYLYRDQMEGIHHHDDQGTYDRPFDLTVQFDPIKIGTIVHDLGESPWKTERPVIVPFIAVHGFDKPYLLDHHLTADMTNDLPVMADQRESLVTIALRYGMSLRFPTEADWQAWKTGGQDLLAPTLSPSKFAFVVGTLEFRLSTFGWKGAWHMDWQGKGYDWRVGGVPYDKALETLVAGVVRVASGHGAPD
jgi:uncharacterized protein